MFLKLTQIYVYIPLFVILCALVTVSSTSLLLVVFMLASTYFSAACLLLIMEAEFLAFVILLVYLGAIAVLFLFVIMLFPAEQGQRFYNLGGIAISTIFFTPVFACIAVQPFESPESLVILSDNIELANQPLLNHLGLVFYSEYVFIFITCGLLLFIALIGCIRLVR